MLTHQIRTDMMAAMKAKDQIKVDTLRSAIAAFTNDLVAKGKKPTDEVTEQDAIGVLKRLAKQRKEAVEAFTTGGRAELAEKEKTELAILEAYLPAAIGRDEIERVAKAKMAELGVTDKAGIGKLTGAVMKELAGRADGNDVKDVLNQLLSP